MAFIFYLLNLVNDDKKNNNATDIPTKKTDINSTSDNDVISDVSLIDANVEVDKLSTSNNDTDNSPTKKSTENSATNKNK